MSTPNEKLGYSTLALLAAFVVAVVASNIWLRGVRVDFTENNLYTLGEGTRDARRHRGADQPLFLLLGRGDRALPTLRTYAARVREMLEEFAGARGQARAERRRSAAVLRGRGPRRAARLQGPTRPGESGHFGLAGSNSVGTTDRISIFDPRKERSSSTTSPRSSTTSRTTDKTVVALLSSAPIGGGFDPQSQQPAQPWVVVEQAKQVLEVRTLPASASIEPDVDVLWIVHPRCSTTARCTRSINSSCAAGERSSSSTRTPRFSPGPDPTGLGIGGAASTSTLEQLFTPGASTSTRGASRRQPLRAQHRRPLPPVRHIGFDRPRRRGHEPGRPDHLGLELRHFGVAGHFELAEGATAKLTPLISSSVESEAMPASASSSCRIPRSS